MATGGHFRYVPQAAIRDCFLVHLEVSGYDSGMDDLVKGVSSVFSACVCFDATAASRFIVGRRTPLCGSATCSLGNTKLVPVIVLCPRDPRKSWQRGSARGQMQKLPSVGKFRHDVAISSVVAQRADERSICI